MKRLFALLVGLICASVAFAGNVKIKGMLTDRPGGRPMTSFPSDTPRLYVLFKTTGMNGGDKIRALWTAIDVGEAAPPNTSVDDRTLIADGDTDDGEFSVSKPTDGWPPGKYRVEIYVNDQIAASMQFTVETPK